MAKKHSWPMRRSRSPHSSPALLNEGRTADKTPTGFAVRMLLRATDELEQLALDMGNMLLS